MLDDNELDQIAWRASRGSHFESAFLGGSKYAQQVIEEDVPKLIAEVRRLQAAFETAERDADEEHAKLIALADEYREYHDNAQAAFKDLMLLIEEHGGRTMMAHATRILKAARVLDR